MEYIKLGTSDLAVSRICLGCMGFGDPKAGQHSWTLGFEETRKIIKYALEKGINFFDTALAYQGGTSEEYVGKSLRELAVRENVVVATKFLPRTDAEIESGVSVREHIRRSLQDSLDHLGMEYVDLLIYHMWDYRSELIEILEALDELIGEGKVRAIGISNCFAWQLARANDLAREHGLHPFVSVQNHYNLIFREEEREMAALCKEDDIAMTPYSSLAAGRLSRKPEESTRRFREDRYARFKYDHSEQEDQKIIREVERTAEERNVSMTTVSLAWLLTRVTAPVVGMTKESQVDAAAEAVEFQLTKEEIRRLEELYIPHRLAGVMAENQNPDGGWKPEPVRENLQILK